MSNPTPPSDSGNQGWTPPQQPQQPPPQYQPQQPPPGYQPPQGYQPPPHQGYQPPPAQQPPPAPKAPSQFTMQNANKLVKDVPQLVKLLRMIAWIELLALPIIAIISFCSIFQYGFLFGSAFSSFSGLVGSVIQAAAIWGILMAVALLLENQAAGRSDK